MVALQLRDNDVDTGYYCVIFTYHENKKYFENPSMPIEGQVIYDTHHYIQTLETYTALFL